MHKRSNTPSNCHLVPTWFHLVPPRQMHKPSHTLSHFHLVPAWFQFVSFHPSEQTVQYSLAVSLGSALVPLGSALSNAQTVHYSLAFPPASAFVPLGSNLSHFFRLSKPSNTLSLFHLVPPWFHLVPPHQMHKPSNTLSHCCAHLRRNTSTHAVRACAPLVHAHHISCQPGHKSARGIPKFDVFFSICGNILKRLRHQA